MARTRRTGLRKTPPYLVHPPMRLILSLLIVLATARGEITPEVPRSVEASHSNDELNLRWETSAGQGYQVQASDRPEGPWLPVGESRIGDGQPMTFGEPRTEDRKFYRVAVSPELFDPATLTPAWQLDAQADFTGAPDGQPVSQWNGTGITSVSQASAADRPILSGGSVIFDGQGDNLSFPMWTGGVGQQWTLAVLLKVRQGVQSGRSFFGCDVTASRALDVSFQDTGLYSFLPGYNPILRTDECAAAPNDNWRVLLLRSTGTTLKVHFDWYDGELAATPNTTTQKGRFNLGCGYVASTSSTPVTIRYASFFPQALSDDDAGKMLRWMERKKDGEYPPLTLIYGGGQSNYIETMSTMRRELPAALDNVALSFGRHYGSSPLNLWMNDNADLTGFEVCPFYDLSAAPPSTKAGWIGANHSGTRILDSWNLRTSQLAKHPKTRKICIFLQGESDVGDSTKLWRPNGDGQWNLTYGVPYWLADTYGRRSVAWNAAIRESTGHQDLVFIYERVAYNPGYLSAQLEEALARQRAAQLVAMADEPRYLLVDTQEFPRYDGVHMSSPLYYASQVPNTGAERLCRATVRLINSSERLVTMSTHARMLAMRAVDSGFTLSEAGFQACEDLAAVEGFTNLRSLVIPTLTAANAVDQERLRRCNLLIHLAGKYAPGFVVGTPASPVATCSTGADFETLQNALEALLLAWGVPGDVTLNLEP